LFLPKQFLKILINFFINAIVARKHEQEFCGVDVGVKKSTVAVIKGKTLEFIGEYSEFVSEFINSKRIPTAAGVDAPLSYPVEGSFRECERLLLKMGIRLFPSGAEFFRKVVERGMEIAKKLEEAGMEVFEVYPYATRVILDLAPNEKKQKKSGLEKIRERLMSYVDIPELSHDAIDAVIGALTVRLYYEGKGVLLRGVDGAILVPAGKIQHSLESWSESLRNSTGGKAYYSGRNRR